MIRKEQEKTRERKLANTRKIVKAHLALLPSHQHFKAIQQHLIQQEKMARLGQLTAGIAYQIKNPINFINNFAKVNMELAQELRTTNSSPPQASNKPKISNY